MHRLLILDHCGADCFERAGAATEPGDQWDVLPLGLNPSLLRRVYEEHLARLSVWRTLDLVPLASDATKRVHAFVLDLIARLPGEDLGGETLIDALASPEGSHWWYLETCEKSPMLTPFIDELYRLALVRVAIERQPYAEVWLALKQAPLRRAIERAIQTMPHAVVLPTQEGGGQQHRPSLWRYWKQAARSLKGFLLIRLVLALTHWPDARSTSDNNLFFLSFYPYWWLNPFGREATERFFTSTPDGVSSCFLVWLSQPRLLWQHRRAVAETARAHDLVPLQRFVSLRTAMRLLSPVQFLRVWRVQTRLRRHLRATFAGFDVSDIVCTEMSHSLTSGQFFLARMMFYACDRFARTVRARALVYRVEFQWWENAVLFGIGGRLPAIGFHHSPLCENYLPLRFAVGELAKALRREQPDHDRPLPTSMLVTGRVGVQRLIADGYPTERIAVCGPQRHGELLAYLRRHSPPQELRRRLQLPAEVLVVFVAAAVVEADNLALLSLLQEIAADLGEHQLLMKTHPANPLQEAAIRAITSADGNRRILIVPPDANMYDYLAASDALVSSGSTIAFEAIALGVMPVVFENPATFPVTSMTEFDDAVFTVRSASELRSVLAAVRAQTQTVRAKQAVWPQTLNYVFGDLATPLPDQLRRALDQLMEVPRASTANERTKRA